MVATAKALFNYALRRAHGTRAVPWLPAFVMERTAEFEKPNSALPAEK